MTYKPTFRRWRGLRLAPVVARSTSMGSRADGYRLKHPFAKSVSTPIHSRPSSTSLGTAAFRSLPSLGPISFTGKVTTTSAMESGTPAILFQPLIRLFARSYSVETLVVRLASTLVSSSMQSVVRLMTTALSLPPFPLQIS